MIKFVLISFIFLLSLSVVFAADVSQFVFTSTGQTIKPNEISETLTVQAQDSAGVSVKLSQTGCLHLETSSGTGQFSSNSTNWESVTSLTMNKNTSNRNFYFKDSSTGNYTLTVKAALISCSDWTTEQWTATQNIIVSDSSQQQSSSQTQVSPTPGVGETSAWPVEPQIYANAGEDKTGVAGADVYFSGLALGFEKQPIDNARFLWNFGDGAFKQGQNISHIYKYPGEYIVVLDVASGKYSASDRALIKIIPNQIKISEANKELIKISNESSSVLDISGWYLRVGGKIFKLPASTLIRANSSLIIPSSNSGIEANNNAELLYPNGSLANSFASVKEHVSDVPAEAPPIVEQTNEQVERAEQAEQTASAVVIIEKQGFWTKGKWWGLAGLIGILSGAGFLIIRRKIA